MHKVQIIGNLTHDPEGQWVGDDKFVCHFPVAVNNRFDESTMWVRVTAWEGLGEVCNEHLSKGNKVFVEGRIDYDTETGELKVWEDKEGFARCKLEIIAKEVEFLTPKGEGGGGRTSSKKRSRGRTKTRRTSKKQEGVRKDIPF